MKSKILLFLVVAIFSSCSIPSTELIGNYQDSPFESQFNSNYKQVWTALEKVLKEEKIPILSNDRYRGVINTETLSFLDSYSIENEDGTIDDPSSRMVVSRVVNGSSLLAPDEIKGKWKISAIPGDKITIIKILLKSPTAYQGTSSATKTRFDIQSTGVFESYLYNLLRNKLPTGLQIETPTVPVKKESNQEIAQAPSVKKEVEPEEISREVSPNEEVHASSSNTSDIAAPKALSISKDEDVVVSEENINSPNTKSSSSLVKPVSTTVSNHSDEKSSSQEEEEYIGNQLSDLQKQIDLQNKIIQDQKNEIDQMKSQRDQALSSNQRALREIQKSTYSNSSDNNLTIQFIAMESSTLEFRDMEDMGEIIVEKVENRNLYRYKVGHFSSRLDANKALIDVRRRGYHDAFIN